MPQLDDSVHALLHEYWGFDRLRPVQADAIAAALAGRDSLVVMPTGGGKSLCYQLPPLVRGETDIVVSPLISLMKDQVDGLVANGYPAAALHSGLTPTQRRDVEQGIARGEYRLVFIAPERLVTSWFLGVAKRIGVRRFAIDEAHCISQWGHDFRPEYRQLAVLRSHFPGASLHAFTATATPRVRDDIAAQLNLKNPAVLVGVFDRPNLIYRIVPQVDRQRQIVEVIRRRPGEAAIVYAISRNDTESLAAMLRQQGIKAAHYHAGMNPGERHDTQEQFSDERLDVVVATVAFGMGIDRSNVRCVIHAAMPKTIESYQQETGRAGRDGLEAECVMLYSPADVMKWESLIRRSAQNAEDPEAVVAAQVQLLRAMQRFAAGITCRHRTLSEYFGQTYENPNCGACDVCLDDTEGVPEATVVAQKILSCVARTGQGFGVGHVVDVLLGGNTEMVRRCGHDQLSTYGLLKEMGKKELQSLVYQLIDQGALGRTEGDRPVLQLNTDSIAILKGQKQVRLIQPRKRPTRRSNIGSHDMEGVDRPLHDHLRGWRRELAAKRGLPPYVIFDDKTLAELARVRPVTTQSLRQVRGIGEKRLADLGDAIVAEVADFCARHGLKTDQPASIPEFIEPPRPGNAVKEAAFAMFREGRSVDETAAATQRARSTVAGYLAEFIETQRPASIDAWVDAATCERVTTVARTMETPLLKPVFDALGGEISYDTIRLVIAHLKTT